MKSFDERADLAAERLVDYLKRYAMGRELGTDDPMYQLGMTTVSYTHLEVYKRQEHHRPCLPSGAQGGVLYPLLGGHEEGRLCPRDRPYGRNPDRRV